ncbi:MAG: LTA synthase family protein [Limosilactobacillus oris]|jgi:lipoteichoic acid synthase|uniref:LTA synthase family protein n=1 Tax=Limosilactobacillus oris TaxID=1632 RepID=UPI0021B2E1A9|nr:LTA synthase family protein [Limosilactobacillus oris]MCH3910915.1 LTA synthase family protein [Limosilactobacillus oris]MCH3938167.1 LTA synthase family protein [Limosilactobacillus oris]MCI1980594.1 LTA synthase family protein [Limosilactobacillus oris]UXC66602.1 LTA synthase family protein [Limosilactobacillus oris]
MKTALQKLRRGLNTKLGFFLLVVLLFCIKSYWAYQNEFNLGVKGSMQHFLLAFNTIPGALVFLGIALYFRGRLSYWLMLIINALLSTWLFSNILYYREFSDFITFNVIKGSGAASNNLGKSLMGIIRPEDFLVYADVIILALVLLFHLIRVDMRRFKIRYAMTVTALGFVLFGANLGMAESDRSQLLTRTFDNNYIVKYLGLQAYTIYDGVKTTHNSVVKARADQDQLKPVLNFIHHNYAGPNVQYEGVAKGKNIFVIHLESLQQFMIDYKQDGQEVMPNLNKLYHASDTLAFDNFFHQVGQGKTADAEMMLENSLYGLPEGSAMVTDGTTNTFQSAPALLHQKLGYTTASFHGDVPSFWNRDNAYKSFGYQYFFSKEYYPKTKDYDAGYGMKDKIFMKESAHYIEQLPQPFYAKLITVTNHYPYILDKQNKDIQPWNTGDDTVDPYVQTARYLDESLGEFLDYLDKSGLRQNSVLILYGDHYGISNNHQPAIAQILHKKKVTNYDLAMFQKVPFMINMPGLKGGIDHTYGGEIDVLPTIEDLLGISSKNYIQFGQDLLSPGRNQIVPFRNGDWVTPKYTKYNGDYYYTKNGKQITKATAKQKKEFSKIQKYVTTDLGLSDRVVNGDLLRFYKLPGFKKVDKKDYTYNLKKSLRNLQDAQKKQKTSAKTKNNNQTTIDDYSTDAPELKDYPKLNFPKP